MRLAAAALALAAASCLGGCNSGGELTGLAAGGATGAATANPALGYAVGIATAVAADEAFKWLGRSREHAEQEAIAEAAGALTEGAVTPWRIRHLIPLGNERGEVQVLRVIATPLAECRDIAFSVVDAPAATWYVTSICRAPNGWHWALGEPAVARWGFLQQ